MPLSGWRTNDVITGFSNFLSIFSSSSAEQDEGYVASTTARNIGARATRGGFVEYCPDA